jgi:hypothetical protein
MISEEAKDFIARLLTLDPQERLGFHGALPRGRCLLESHCAV